MCDNGGIFSSYDLRMHLLHPSFFIFAAVVASAPLCSAGVVRDDIAAGNDNCPTCQSLAAQPWYPGVGWVTWSEGGFSNFASGTYIGGGWVLTAAHVADGTNYTGGGISNFKFILGSNTYTANASVVGNF